MRQQGRGISTHGATTQKRGFIVTFNLSDFRGAEKFGINVVEPRRFLRTMGEII